MEIITFGVALLLATGPAGVVVARSRHGHELVYGACALASAVIALVAVGFLLDTSAGEPTMVLPFGLPWLQAHFRLNELSAYFLLVVNLLSAIVGVYALGYGRHEADPERVLPAYPLFIAGMNLVLLSDDAFSFLLAWEFMSVTSWLLVMATHRQPGTAQAGYVYLVMAAIGGIALLLAFGVLAGVAGDYSFEAIRAASRGQAATAAAILLTILGAGSKAGLVPMHAWLPLAHPAAPSHVSALMSGAMTKVALYAILRVLFDLAPGRAEISIGWWPGLVLIALGALSTLMGALYALWQSDLKKLLAYSTVENVGIVALGLGLALVFRATGLDGLAGLSLAAALLHALNHSLLKGLLFCGAGAVITATGERDIERLGGLIHRMPATAACFLIGAAGLSALPPLNGFVSEWLTFQAILGGTKLPPWELKFAVVVAGAMLALAAALAATVFVRAFGISFLGRPRSRAAAEANEVELSMRLALYSLVGLCFLLGALPLAVVHLAGPVAQQLFGQPLALAAGSTWLWLVPFSTGISSYGAVVLLAALAGLALVVILAIHNLAGRRIRRGPAWDCGFPDPRPETQYSASSFAQPLRRVFGTNLFRAREQVEMPAPGAPEAARLTVSLHDLAWEYLYLPVAGLVDTIADRLNMLQFLTIRRYLSLMFMALALLLIVVAVSE
jgi:formate hydrogenlyase subunit 3/multisubunit Na+/H+ antiporter MnhD subunit